MAQHLQPEWQQGGMTDDPFVDLVGIEFDDVSARRVTAHLEADRRHQQPYGIVNGGVYATLVESLASYGAGTYAFERGLLVVGVSNATDFVRAHRTGRLDAVAEPVHQGRGQQLWEVRITRASDDKLVARGQVRLQHVEVEQLGEDRGGRTGSTTRPQEET